MTDRVLTGKESAGKCTGDHDLCGAPQPRVIAAGFALQDWDSERPKIIGAHVSPYGEIALSGFAADNLEFVGRKVHARRQEGVESGGHYARNRSQALKC